VKKNKFIPNENNSLCLFTKNKNPVFTGFHLLQGRIHLIILKEKFSQLYNQQIMRLLIFIFTLSPFLGIGQRTDVFIKLTDARGQQIKGDAVLKGFENWMGATTFNTASKTNTLLSFTMTVNGASADLKKAAANGEILLGGQVTVITPNPSGGKPMTSYTIKMENISVLSCYESMGCNNAMNTTVSLQATRIGWTYYNTSATGAQTVSRKFGWDSDKNQDWNSF